MKAILFSLVTIIATISLAETASKTPLTSTDITAYKKEVGLAEADLIANHPGLKCNDEGDNQQGADWGRVCFLELGNFSVGYQIEEGVVSLIRVASYTDNSPFPDQKMIEKAFGESKSVEIGSGCFGKGEDGLVVTIGDVSLVTSDMRSWEPPPRKVGEPEPNYGWEIYFIPSKAIKSGRVETPYYCEG